MGLGENRATFRCKYYGPALFSNYSIVGAEIPLPSESAYAKISG